MTVINAKLGFIVSILKRKFVIKATCLRKKLGLQIALLASLVLLMMDSIHLLYAGLVLQVLSLMLKVWLNVSLAKMEKLVLKDSRNASAANLAISV